MKTLPEIKAVNKSGHIGQHNGALVFENGGFDGPRELFLHDNFGRAQVEQFELEVVGGGEAQLGRDWRKAEGANRRHVVAPHRHCFSNQRVVQKRLTRLRKTQFVPENLI